MKVKIDKSRRVYKGNSNNGRINENKYEVLEFVFPEELEDFTKYIEIEATDNEGTLRYADRIEDNEFAIDNTLSKYSLITAQVVCKDLRENIVFKSNPFEFTFEQSLNIMEDIEEEQQDLLDRIELELQEAKEDITELQETEAEHAEQIQANATDIATLQGQVATNETDIANIKTKNTQQDNAIETNTQDISDIKAEQTTQNTNITSNTNRIAVLEHDSGNKVALSIDSNYVMTLQLLNKNNEVLSTGTIDLPIESMIVNVSYSNGILTLTLQNGRTLDVDISDIVSGLVSETTFNNAISQLQGSINSLTTRMTQAETNIQENIDDIEALTTKHNTEVAELQSQIEDLQEENQALADQIPTGDASGSDITLSDSARYKFKKIVPGGKSEQETYKGTNVLIPLYEEGYTSTKNGVTATIQENGEVKLVGASTNNISFELYKINLEENKSYYANIFNSLYGSSNVYLQMNGSDYTFYKNFFNSTSPYNSTVNDASAKVFVYIPNGVTINTVIKPMIQIGSEATEYEKYVGGQPAPNPTYECPIKNVGDNINIFDKSSTPMYKDQLETQEIKTGVRVTTQNTGTYHIALYLLDTATNLKGKEITVSANIVPSSSNLGGLGIVLCDADGSNRTAIAQKNSITGKQCLTAKIDESYDDNKVIALRLYSNLESAATGDYVDYEELKVEEGAKATSYSAYNCGNVEVKVENKNLFDESTVSFITGILDDNGNNTGSTTSHYTENFYEVIANTPYTLSGTISINNSSYRIYFYNKNKEWISRSSSMPNNQRTFTTPAECYYIRIQIIRGIELKTGDVQLEEGSTATDYIPHEEQTVTFPLEEGQVLHLGDTIEDKIVQKRGTYHFTGNENWSYSGNTTNISICCYTNSITPIPKNNGTTGLLNIGTVCNYTILQRYITCFAYNVGNNHFLKIEKTAIPNWDESLTNAEKVALFKAYLAQQYANGTPVTIEYELENPIETEFTQAQKTAKAQIDKLYSYKGTTHITSNANLDVTYRKDIETMIDKIEELDARLSLLES